MNINTLEPRYWRLEIIEYQFFFLTEKYKDLFYIIIGDELYIQMSDGTLARCLCGFS